jgi:hypothetical protein
MLFILLKLTGRSLRIHTIDLKQISIPKPNGTQNKEDRQQNDEANASSAAGVNNAGSQEVKAADRSVETMFPLEMDREQRVKKSFFITG